MPSFAVLHKAKHVHGSGRQIRLQSTTVRDKSFYYCIVLYRLLKIKLIVSFQGGLRAINFTKSIHNFLSRQTNCVKTTGFALVVLKFVFVNYFQSVLAMCSTRQF